METEINPKKVSFWDPIRNLSILVMLGGIFGLISVLLIFLINPLHGLAIALVSIGLIISSVGLIKMRRWALYSFTAVVIFEVIGAFYSIINQVATILTALVLVFFWIKSKKFS